MKNKYELPIADVINIGPDDIITTSPGTETSPKDEDDGIWDLNLNI